MNVFFISLGCDKNLVDTEKMLALLDEAGYGITDDENDAEVCIVNTCCFIGDAKEESIECLLETAELKKTARLKYLIAAGCLAQRYKDEIIREIPEVDAVIGTYAVKELVDVIRSLESGNGKSLLRVDDSGYEQPGTGRIRSGVGHYSYLKISDGCSKRCTYCIIPYVRGGYRSAPKEDLIREASVLASSGVNELILVAQETTMYGTDIYGRKALPELLRGLADIEGIDWIRLMYCYPEEIDDELIRVFKEEPKLCRYIDLPIQHISDSILKKMGRRTNGREIKDLISRLREEIPGIAIRTSLISGFPGETEEDHELLKSFVEEMKLDRVGVFTYSREEGTPAAAMKDQVKKSVSRQRRKELMLAQQKVVFEKNRSFAGSNISVIIDGKLSDEDVYVGRTYRDAPDIDGCVFVKTDRELISGMIIDAQVTGFKDYDLIAVSN